MLKIEGVFKCKEIQKINNTPLLRLVNSDKDQDGNYKQTYYSLWVNDKVQNLFTTDLKRKLTKTSLKINGWLRVKIDSKYTNLTIYPSSVEEYKKGGMK